MVPICAVERYIFLNNFLNILKSTYDVNKLMEIYGGKYGYPYYSENSTPEEIYGIRGSYFTNFNEDAIISMFTPAGQPVPYNEIPINSDYGKKIDDESAIQPSSECVFHVTDDGNVLKWDYNLYDLDKDNYVENSIKWLEYLIINFFQKWNIELNGILKWTFKSIEDQNDETGSIEIYGNTIIIIDKYGRVEKNLEQVLIKCAYKTI